MLKTAVEKRTGQLAFRPDALRVVVQASGGIFRDLVNLARHACLLAESAGKDRVTSAEAEAALREQRLKHTATLSPGDRGLLDRYSQSERTWVDKEMFEQVNQGRIVAYHRENLWFDVHPILWPLFRLKYPEAPSEFS